VSLNIMFIRIKWHSWRLGSWK